MTRRELIAAAVASLVPVAVLPDEVVDLKLILLDEPTDDNRRITHPRDVVVRDLGNLGGCEIRKGWDGDVVGRVELWFVRDGWLCASGTVRKSVSDSLEKGELIPAPSLFEKITVPHTAGNPTDNLLVSTMTGAERVAVLTPDHSLWNDKR